MHDEADGLVSRDGLEDFNLQELEKIVELYEEEKHGDPNPGKPSAATCSRSRSRSRF